MDNFISNKNKVFIKSKHRVQKHGEVFTPQWVIDKMIAIPGIKEKAEDISATFLEPSAGEGAFLLAIENIKLGVAKERYSKPLFARYALWALTSIYGIEVLEDNLALARQNMLELFADYYEAVYGEALLEESDIYKSAKTIIWANIVQGDTLTHENKSAQRLIFSRWEPIGEPPHRVKRITFLYSSLFEPEDKNKEVQIDLFNIPSALESIAGQHECFAPTDIELVWKAIRDMPHKQPEKFRFDVIIGNPPYQEETKDTSDKPIYNLFMDEAFKIAERVSFITPARFLFNAGKTPKTWNKKMLEDKHLKIMFYEQDSSKVFSNTDIKGGVAITYRDTSINFGVIEIFTAFQELNSILKKVQISNKGSFRGIIYGQNIYQYTDRLHTEFPNAKSLLSKSHKYDVTTNAFSKLDFIFLDIKPNDGFEYIQILGLQNNNRVYKWVRQDYISEHESLNKYKVFVAKSNGSGAFGEVLSSPLIGMPYVGSTQTFLTIGAFNTKEEAEAALKYICTKFARALLGVLK
ncbi:MAG TPA: Eco57I restriction-modification methylase domain-containing protein, partial [Clostridia bacterium]|nr:Eco57I restriction-modification methylase domain-containing protein [Clostridia bacterium]